MALTKRQEKINIIIEKATALAFLNVGWYNSLNDQLSLTIGEIGLIEHAKKENRELFKELNEMIEKDED